MSITEENLDRAEAIRRMHGPAALYKFFGYLYEPVFLNLISRLDYCQKDILTNLASLKAAQAEASIISTAL
jgi:hypothetical protein